MTWADFAFSDPVQAFCAGANVTAALYADTLHWIVRWALFVIGAWVAAGILVPMVAMS